MLNLLLWLLLLSVPVLLLCCCCCCCLPPLLWLPTLPPVCWIPPILPTPLWHHGAGAQLLAQLLLPLRRHPPHGAVWPLTPAAPAPGKQLDGGATQRAARALRHPMWCEGQLPCALGTARCGQQQAAPSANGDIRCNGRCIHGTRSRACGSRLASLMARIGAVQAVVLVHRVLAIPLALVPGLAADYHGSKAWP